MSSHHSIDYKKTAINYYLQNKSYRKTCEIFNCSKTSLQRWVNKYLTTNNIERKQSKKKIIFDNEKQNFIKTHIKEYPNTSLKQIAKETNKKFKTTYNYVDIHRLLTKELNITYKKLRMRYFPAKGNEKEELKEFYKILLKHDKDKIISIDETAIYINMIQSHGRNDKGRRVYYNTNLYPYKKYNCLCAIKYGKIIGIQLFEETGGINKNDFINFIDIFIKNKYKNHVLLLDNAIFHKAKEVKEKILETENNYLYSVRYRPNTNLPIEGFFNQLKHYLKIKSPQNFEEIVKNIKEIIKENIKKINLENYFNYLFLKAQEFIKKNP
jgi:transposase